MSHVMVATRTCAREGCDEPVIRRQSESYSRFANRRYCSRSCASKCRPGIDAYRKGRKEYVLGEVEFLLGTDTAESLSRRLGYANAESLCRSLQNWGRHDLAGRLLPARDYRCTPAAALRDGKWIPTCTCRSSAHIPHGTAQIYADDRDALAEARRLLKEDWL